jgi:hypothetical protein
MTDATTILSADGSDTLVAVKNRIGPVYAHPGMQSSATGTLFREGEQKGLYFMVPFSWETHLIPAGETMNLYCVILCTEPLVNPVPYPRTKCFFLRAPSAGGAIEATSAGNPQWRVIGIEPGHLFARLLRTDPSLPTPHNGRAA